ncbi:MAG: hypothetical protein Q8Q02_12545 [Nocardioides sp.]|nr:hypothetical protein [Nocardioides sp.]
MVLDIAYYEATAQLIPILLLALLVMEVMRAPYQSDHPDTHTRNAAIAMLAISALATEAVTLGVLAAQQDTRIVAGFVISGTGATASVVLLSHLSRLAFVDFKRTKAISSAPMIVAAVIGAVVIFFPYV